MTITEPSAPLVFSNWQLYGLQLIVTHKTRSKKRICKPKPTLSVVWPYLSNGQSLSQCPYRAHGMDTGEDLCPTCHMDDPLPFGV